MGFERKLVERHIWRRLFFEKLTEPIHVNLLALGMMLVGTYRMRVLFDLVLRECHAYGVLRAADLAKESGIEEFTAIEFGVATGAGLLNMAHIARKVTKITGVRINV